MKRRSAWWIVLGACAGGAIGFAIAWQLAGAEVGKLGDWRQGATRFVGAVSAFGLLFGFALASRFTRGVKLSRDGFTLSYRRIEPTTSGYRELATVTIELLMNGLREVGYKPSATACDHAGEERGPIDPATPLAGANFAIRDPGVRGYIRLQLAPPPHDQARGMGLCEVWSGRGESAEELALFALRVLDPLIGDLRGARETSRLSEDPASVLTSMLDARPQHRRG